MRDPEDTRRQAPRPLAFARDAKRAVGALVRDSLALATADRGANEASAQAAIATGRVIGIARKPRHRGPMEMLDRAEITTESGLVGNANGRPGRRQVTVLTREGWDAACRELGREVGWGTRRANLWIEGIAVARRVGARLVIGEVVLEITGETTPCSRMDAQVPGLTSALTPDWRAGVTCRVVHGGTVRLGDVVGIASP
ncbi:MAG: MOSC domain-containing protein [bacterium]